MIKKNSNNNVFINQQEVINNYIMLNNSPQNYITSGYHTGSVKNKIFTDNNNNNSNNGNAAMHQ